MCVCAREGSRHLSAGTHRFSNHRRLYRSTQRRPVRTHTQMTSLCSGLGLAGGTAPCPRALSWGAASLGFRPTRAVASATWMRLWHSRHATNQSPQARARGHSPSASRGCSVRPRGSAGHIRADAMTRQRAGKIPLRTLVRSRRVVPRRLIVRTLCTG